MKAKVIIAQATVETAGLLYGLVKKVASALLGRRDVPQR